MLNSYRCLREGKAAYVPGEKLRAVSLQNSSLNEFSLHILHWIPLSLTHFDGEWHNEDEHASPLKSISQSFPAKLSGHVQKYPPSIEVHVAPFLHGLE